MLQLTAPEAIAVAHGDAMSSKRDRDGARLPAPNLRKRRELVKRVRREATARHYPQPIVGQTVAAPRLG
jgi:hypothetical protein